MLITDNLKRLVYTALARFQNNMLWLIKSTTVLLDDFILIRYSVIQLINALPLSSHHCQTCVQAHIL